jgi:hypothetical protein
MRARTSAARVRWAQSLCTKRGQEGQALGRSRGGFTTKVHAKSDASGDIIAFDLTGGEAFDGRHFNPARHRARQRRSRVPNVAVSTAASAAEVG